eukprot:491881-Pleurochrysis_carterae.AAC.3
MGAEAETRLRAAASHRIAGVALGGAAAAAARWWFWRRGPQSNRYSVLRTSATDRLPDLQKVARLGQPPSLSETESAWVSHQISPKLLFRIA